MASPRTEMDMKAARSNVLITVETVRDYIFAGREKWEAHSKIENILQNDPAFDKSQRDFVGRVESYERSLVIGKRLVELQRIHAWTKEEMQQAIIILSEVLPITLHDIVFEPVFVGQASSEMMDKYWDLVSNKGIQGCYLQTELGHGSNVACLETTAAYLPESQEFEIHSPTLTSTKWWIGGLGKTATHGIVQAKLILPGGKDMGPHLFLVQLRSLEDHSVLPGISIGDIGPKACGGMAAMDNGFARFHHVRIPRTNMFSKFAEVTADARYIQPRNPKHSFGGMMYIRASLVTSAGWTIARAITIAIRYATVRRQGDPDAHGVERPVMQYPSTYYRLLPILSHAYVFILLGRQTTELFTAFRNQCDRGDFTDIGGVHALLCGLKILVTSTAIKDLETARRALGGHGYSAFAGIGRLYANYLPAATYEGDNFMLDGQVTRAAVKSYQSSLLIPPHQFGVYSSYIRLLNDKYPMPIADVRTWQNPPAVIHLLEWRAALMLKSYVQNRDELDANANQRLSKAVTDAYVACRLGDVLEGLVLPDKERNAIGKLYHLFLLTSIEDGLADLFSLGLLRSSDRDLRLAIKALCCELLPSAIGLVDAFAFSDWALDSALGVSDGRVYEELWRRVQLNPFNYVDSTTTYRETLGPMLREGRTIAKGVNSRL